MKTLNKKIACFCCIVAFMISSPLINGQGSKLSKQEKKEARIAIMNANFYILDSLINAKSFVLEADFLMDKYGQRISVVSTVNFIRVNDSRGVLQTGTTSMNGYNGVGGVTAEGTIGSWEVEKNVTKLTHRVRFTLMTNLGIYDVSMNVSSDNYASATITGLGPGNLTWQGHISTVGNARIFKGQNTI